MSKEYISYDQFSVCQFLVGFWRITKEEKTSNLEEHRLDYLISLFDDANGFSWNVAKANQAMLPCRVDYSQTERIDKIRRANAQRHVSNIGNPASKKILSKSSKIHDM